MSVPKKKRSKSKQKPAQVRLLPRRVFLVACPKCKKPKQPHIVCEFCGTYKGKQILDMGSKVKKVEKKETVEEKELATKEAAS